MTSKLRTKWFKLSLVFRHRWGEYSYESFKMKRNYELGVWLKTYKAVGNTKCTLKFIFSDKNSVKGYIFGVNLIFCKIWIDISGPTLELNLNNPVISDNFQIGPHGAYEHEND